MYIVELTYVKPLAELDAHLAAHRAFLDTQYAKENFLLSGAQTPRVGGVFVASGRLTRDELNEILAHDPFQQNGLATYRVIEFTPTKSAPALAGVL